MRRCLLICARMCVSSVQRALEMSSLMMAKKAKYTSLDIRLI